MFDVITFGSATCDIFVKSSGFKIISCPDFLTGQALAVEAGSKALAEELVFATGGGGTNAAATFALQGLDVAYVGLVGNDSGGLEIFRELSQLKVDCAFLKTTCQAKTPYSIILSAAGQERSILVFEGASHLLGQADIPWDKIKQSKCFYIAGLSGQSAEIFEPLVNFAAENKIKLAVNPGRDQLGEGLETLKKLLSKIDILLVNQEEASRITGVSFEKEEELFKKFDELVPGLAVMSKGPAGVAVSDGRQIYRAGIPESKYLDRTGSGDAFGSGFVSVILKGGTIEEAIQFGTANATSTIAHWGAKNGLLKRNDWGPWEKVKVSINQLSQ